MKRFHISLSTEHYDASVDEYTKRLGCQPNKTIPGRYARWQTELLNFTLSCKPGQKGGMVRHIGFEDEKEQGFREEADVNGIVWEYFNTGQQDKEINHILEQRS